ncbi:MAG: dienelactone hydrolase family protein [Anaerolineae bacterium]
MTPEHAEARREQLWSLLGDLPPRDRPVTADTVATREGDGYHLEVLRLDLNGIEPVPTYFAYPASGSGPWPLVLFNHSHGGDYEGGKEEMVRGRGYLQNPPYATELTRAGYCALCFDTWNFGERRGRPESALFKQLLWHGQVLWGLMVYDSVKALDYLCGRADVDASRIATMGISMGSTMAWWLAALDTRVQVCIDLCCLTDYQALIETRGLDQHGLYYYVPGLLKHFTTADINALIAPRPHLSIAGLFDGLTPPAGLDRVDAALRQEYADAGAPERWRLSRYQTGHFETAAGRREVMAFLRRWL